MKTTLTLFLIATTAFAGYRDDAGAYLAADTGRLVAWLGSATAYTTNASEVVTANPFANGEAYLQTLWSNVGGNVTNSFETNMAILKSAKAAADAETADAIRDLALEILAVYTKLKSEGCQFTGIASTTNTVITLTPSRYRWQDYGFDHAPTGADVESR